MPCSLTSLLTSLASGVFLSSVFFTSGVVPGLTGDMEGEATGLAVATGAGVGAGLFGTSGFGSQAPNTAVETAKTVDKIKVLLIVILLNNLLNTDSRRPLADIRSRNERDTALSRFAANLSKNIEARHRTYSTLRPIERAGGGNLQEIYLRSRFRFWGRWSIARRRLARYLFV